MSILSAAERAELVAVAEGEMVDECEIRDDTGSAGTLNPTTLEYEGASPASLVYAGKCQLLDQGQISDISAGGQDTTVQGIVVKLPIAGSETVRTGHVVKMTAAGIDAGNLGRRFRVNGVLRATSATARRLQCVEITGSA